MAIDFKTAMAAQQAKAEVLAWVYEQIRRDVRVRAANEAAARVALKRAGKRKSKKKQESGTSGL